MFKTTKSYFNKLFFTKKNINKENTTIQNLVDNYDNYLAKNNLINTPYQIVADNSRMPLYDYKYNINIPTDFNSNKINKEIFLYVNKYLSEYSIPVIFLHEMGHLNHHQFLNKNYSSSFNYDSNSNYIHTNSDELNNFLVFLSGNKVISHFIHTNFRENYADCYSACVLYHKHNNTQILDNIIEYRKEMFDIFKKQKTSIKIDNNNNLEIMSGPLSISSYSGIDVVENLKQNILKKISHQDFTQIPLNTLHDLIQIESLESLKTSLKKELETNPVFLSHFKTYIQDKKFTNDEDGINKYFEQFDFLIKDNKEKTKDKIISHYFNEDIAPTFKELITHHNKKEFFTPFNFTNEHHSLIKNYFSLIQQEELYLSVKNLNLDKLQFNFLQTTYKKHYLFKNSNPLDITPHSTFFNSYFNNSVPTSTQKISITKLTPDNIINATLQNKFFDIYKSNKNKPFVNKQLGISDSFIHSFEPISNPVFIKKSIEIPINLNSKLDNLLNKFGKNKEDDKSSKFKI